MLQLKNEHQEVYDTWYSEDASYLLSSLDDSFEAGEQVAKYELADSILDFLNK